MSKSYKREERAQARAVQQRREARHSKIESRHSSLESTPGRGTVQKHSGGRTSRNSASLATSKDALSG